MSEEPTTKTTTQPNEEVVLDKFNEIKERYETELGNKDKEIAELKKQLEAKDNEVNDTVKSLNDEVNEKLAQAEELNKLRENVQELLNDKAQALVDKYISEGKLVPAQKEKALNLCLADQDMFISLYENAPSIVDTNPKPKSKRISNVEKLGDYFKN
ncbi:MAG: hypothetical protein IKF79_01450 [Methanosphaera sp.]|nr:hypothetical protein [Methanosphaera sp.]